MPSAGWRATRTRSRSRPSSSTSSPPPATRLDLAQALPIYRDLHSLLRWDSKTEFVQAIKLSMDVAGRKGGICRPPRAALPTEIHDRVVADTEAALGQGLQVVR